MVLLTETETTTLLPLSLASWSYTQPYAMSAPPTGAVVLDTLEVLP